MPEFGAGLPWQARRMSTLSAVEELAAGGLEEHMRLDAAARVLVAARRVASLRRAGALPAPRTVSDEAAWVTGLAAAWDPHATTATEFAETLLPQELDRLLAAAPIWAREVARAAGTAKPVNQLRAA